MNPGSHWPRMLVNITKFIRILFQIIAFITENVWRIEKVCQKMAENCSTKMLNVRQVVGTELHKFLSGFFYMDLYNFSII